MATEQQLIQQLNRLKVHTLETERLLVEKLRLGLPRIQIEAIVNLFPKPLSVTLSYWRTDAGNHYELDWMEVRLKRGIPVQHAIIADVDTADLEAKMQLVNWNRLPDTPETVSEIRNITDALWQLEETEDPFAFQICQALYAKYWSGTPFSNSSIENRASSYISKKVYKTEEDNICNLYLAYQDITGKRAELQRALAAMGLNIEIQTDRQLSYGNESFNLSPSIYLPEGLVNLTIPMKRDKDNDYNASFIKATFHPHPQIDHAIILGIDTAQLESAMASIDWIDDSTHYVQTDEEEYQYTDEIERIMSLVDERLPMDPLGRSIWDKLQVKYWAGSPDFEDQMSESAKELYKSLTFSSVMLPFGIQAKAVCNLFLGKAIYLDSPLSTNDPDPHWVKLGARDQYGNCTLIKMSGLTLSELGAMTQNIPAPLEQLSEIIPSLLVGDDAFIELNNGTMVKAILDPEKDTIRIYNSQGERIPMNLRMKPDWREESIRFRPFISEGRPPHKKGPSF